MDGMGNMVFNFCRSLQHTGHHSLDDLQQVQPEVL